MNRVENPTIVHAPGASPGYISAFNAWNAVIGQMEANPIRDSDGHPLPFPLPPVPTSGTSADAMLYQRARRTYQSAMALHGGMSGMGAIPSFASLFSNMGGSLLSKAQGAAQGAVQNVENQVQAKVDAQTAQLKAGVQTVKEIGITYGALTLLFQGLSAGAMLYLVYLEGKRVKSGARRKGRR